MSSKIERKQVNNKILVLGIDGMDPRATEYYLSQGRMPNTRKLLERGAANEHLNMIGGHPTGTPPMWTTLATGCYANVHGITCFNLPSDKGLEYFSYGLDSRKCLAEPLWNVFVEAGMKTLVWHWPGSSWPPTSDNPLLHVVDGTQPEGVNMGVAVVAKDFFVAASKDETKLEFRPKGEESQGIAPCAIEDLDEGGEKKKDENDVKMGMSKPDSNIVLLNNREGTEGYGKFAKYDYVVSPIKPAEKWAEAPEDALEFTILMSAGFLRRPALIVKNEDGIYDTVKIYVSKKDVTPLAVLKKGVMVHDIIDYDFKGNDKLQTIKSIVLMDLAQDGSKLKMYVSPSMTIDDNRLFHPQYLYDNVVANVGYPGPVTMLVAEDGDELYTCMKPLWDRYDRWQSEALHYLIETEDYDVVFSHCHNVDAEMHMTVNWLKRREYSRFSPETAAKFMETIYDQTDEYIGSFLHLLDEGWTIFLVSDHALVCPEYKIPEFGDICGVNVGLMRDLGYTVMKKDENGNDTHEIDWTKTRAIASRGNHIYLNLKGRYDHGIVDPEDQYELEEQIMTDLYGVKDAESGKRVFALALRNKDGVILGYGGDRCGDILVWTAEGYNGDHFDGLTTCYGLNHTSLEPIFIAAGKGIKEGQITKRVIRQVDVVPTVAVIGGVRMPEECEGAPVYQILENNY